MARLEWLRSFRAQWWTAELDDLAARAEAIGRLEEAYQRAAAREHDPPPAGHASLFRSQSSVTTADSWTQRPMRASGPFSAQSRPVARDRGNLLTKASDASDCLAGR
jgi:hypothetical protein